MKTERQRRQNQNKRTTNPTLNGVQSNNRAERSQKDIETTSPLEASYSLKDGSLHRNQYVEGKIEWGNALISSKPIFKQSGVEMASEINSVDMLFDGPWRSPDSELASVSDIIEKKLSSESIDSDILNSSLDFAPSLDDVFDVLDEMDSLESSRQMNTPSTTPSTHPMPQMSRTNNLFLPPSASGSHPWNSSEGFNFGLVKGLQNPSRGLITAMRRLCELLSKPRSDHLESVFVRLLNNALSDMEDATQPQSKRPRRNNDSERLAVSKSQRKRPSKSASDVDRNIESPKIELLTRSIASKSQPLPVISARAGRRTETVDLTSLEEIEKKQQQDCKESKKEPLIALEDTMSVFMSSLSNIAAK